MAVGDVRSGLSSVAASGSLDIRPPTTEEWVIHNIYHEYDVDIAVTDGTNELIFDGDKGPGAYAKFAFHVTNQQWIRVKNRDTSNPRLIGYDGVVTRG
jgi:hypothetical protein